VGASGVQRPVPSHPIRRLGTQAATVSGNEVGDGLALVRVI
jgi:hypothetical protein